MVTGRNDHEQQGAGSCDVLVVGAGPTGLTLAAWLDAFGVSVRLVDRSVDRVHESRALAVQARTLEVLRGLGLADDLVRRGNPTVRLAAQVGRRVVRLGLFDIGVADTAFPYLLFVSQAETEQLLGEYLHARGVRVERGVELASFTHSPGGVDCVLRARDGAAETVRAAYLVGCDGAHSTVRQQAGVQFVGARYPQTFLLADLPADGLEPDAVNTFLTDHGPLFFFPLAHPAPWRLLTLRPESVAPGNGSSDPVPHVSDLQTLSDAATGGRVRLGEPVWATMFHVHHRLAARYRAGRVFLAGDAAHVHSPAGAQGMNTGIQDAWNLGWKLALVLRDAAPPELLDSYEAERRPVGAFVLRFTDWAFTAATSTNRLAQVVRGHVVLRVAPVALRFRLGRAAAFRTVSQLGIRYRHSPAVQRDRRRRPSPRPGDRLPDARVTSDGRTVWLHETLTAPAYHLLLCGPTNRWDTEKLDGLRARSRLTLHLLDRHAGPGVLHDADGAAHSRLHVHGSTQLLVRPDGHVAYRADTTDLTGVTTHLDHWLRPPQRPA